MFDFSFDKIERDSMNVSLPQWVIMLLTCLEKESHQRFNNYSFQCIAQTWIYTTAVSV